MIIDTNLWTVFNDSKDALLEALKAPVSRELHILSLPASDRAPLVAAMSQLAKELLVSMKLLEDACRDLLEVKQLLRMQHTRASMSLSPIGALPYELIHRIIAFAVHDPLDNATILRLSHVSNIWRTVVISSSEFFTAIDWNRWNSERIFTWRMRSDLQPLSICLLLRTSNKLWGYDVDDDVDGRNPRDWALLDELSNAMANCSDLDIRISTAYSLRHFSEWFLDMRAPCLRRLSIFVNERHWYGGGGDFTVYSENSPSLEIVEVYSALPKFVDMHTITDITYHSPTWSSWSSWAETLNTLERLERLTIIGLNEVIALNGVPLLELPALKFLKLEALRYHEPLSQIIRSLVAPNLRWLVLERIRVTENESEAFWIDIVSTACNADVILVFTFVHRMQPCQVSHRLA